MPSMQYLIYSNVENILGDGAHLSNQPNPLARPKVVGGVGPRAYALAAAKSVRKHHSEFHSAGFGERALGVRAATSETQIWPDAYNVQSD